MNREQLLNKVVKPTLQEIPRGYSEKACLAIMMIIAHESQRGEYLTQLNNGPAKGIIQMEGWVHDDVWQNSDSIRRNALKLGFIAKETETPTSDKLYSDLAYNVFMARQRLFMDVNPLPTEPREMSAYLKKFWNSAQGKADDMSYLKDYEQWS
jgi:hypothetical protein